VRTAHKGKRFRGVVRGLGIGALFLGFALASNTSQASSPFRQAAGQDTAAVESVIEASDCTSCHSVDRTVVGPSYLDVARRYFGQAGIAEDVGRSIREGGSGRWGDVPMTAHPDLDDGDLEAVVAWILSLDAGAAPVIEAAATEYTYALEDGTSVDLDFQLFVQGQAPMVTKDVFTGYLMYNSYCFRCHGQDATESQLAPDLKLSLSRGMTAQEYLSITMAGRDEEGMPSWAGFLTEEEVRDIYMYVQGRRLGLVRTGRPPSEY
jgi:cytochrome c